MLCKHYKINFINRLIRNASKNSLRIRVVSISAKPKKHRPKLFGPETMLGLIQLKPSLAIEIPI